MLQNCRSNSGIARLQNNQNRGMITIFKYIRIYPPCIRTRSQTTKNIRGNSLFFDKIPKNWSVFCTSNAIFSKFFHRIKTSVFYRSSV